ncbi:MAG: glycogen/starch/alpha-glucan phosphorylase, partial [Candidatus Omnitrophica bacterium]|nr:glycogen/starch/alpha-glucan phosphorylase [Candidatus Omnitrophota bacterium]
MAKKIIKLINNIATTINSDKSVSDKIKVVFLENYCVSVAEKVFPASDLSEQISTAGCEASGTGNMKFMMNGALTIGTYDGANIEIAEAVGKDNIFIFGLKVEEILQLQNNRYNPQDYINSFRILSEVIKLIQSDYFSNNEKGIFEPIIESIYSGDRYFICADFEDYYNTQKKVDEVYLNQDAWVEKSIINVANSGTFSSDNTIRNYARDIWKIATGRT